MKEYPPKEIEQAKAYFQGKGYEVKEERVGDLDVSYFVLPQSLAELPDFAWRMTYTVPETGEVIGAYGVSDNVPEELRPYWAAHEKIEFEQEGITTTGRCLSAEQKVIGLVPDILRNNYIAKREEFFTNLVEYFRKDLKAGADNYTKADFREVVTVRQYLRGLRAQRSAK